MPLVPVSSEKIVEYGSASGDIRRKRIPPAVADKNVNAGCCYSTWSHISPAVMTAGEHPDSPLQYFRHFDCHTPAFTHQNNTWHHRCECRSVRL